MNEPRVTIRLDTDRRVFRPGETLSGEYRIEEMAPGDIQAIELSVLWYTEGKGDEDLAVHFFHRVSQEDATYFDARRPSLFSTELPRSPLSYEGAIVSIRWCVRVRVFPAHGKELSAEHSFQLGDVPPAQVAPQASAEPPEGEREQAAKD
ncbi:MAG: hypothetical protein ACYC35_19055 [Pirellulales bacterium]